MNERFILIVITRNSPGVLSRISSLLRRKLFNIDSLTVGRMVNNAESRFTIVIDGDENQANKAALLIERLIEIRSVRVMKPDQCLRREIVLARIKITDSAQELLLDKAESQVLSQEISRADNLVTLELIDTSQKLDAFLEKIGQAKIEVVDWVRSGVIAMEN
jgi:acetolactate synthase-1/3 small subunit